MPRKQKNPLMDGLVRFSSSPEAAKLDGSLKEILAKLANMTAPEAREWLVANPTHALAANVKAIVDTIPTGRGPTMSRAQQHAEYITQPELIAAVERRFGPIVWDLAASAKSSKGSKGFFGLDDDSLKCSWEPAIEAVRSVKDGIGWLNPPYGKEAKSPGIAPWMEKTFAQTRARGFRMTTLTPVSTGQWFYRHVFNKAGVILLDGRLTFVGEEDPYPKDCMICHYGADVLCGVWLWDWRTDEFVPLHAQRPEAWTCGKCGRPRVNLDGHLTQASDGLCYTCRSETTPPPPKAKTKAKAESKAAGQGQLSLVKGG